MTNSPKDRDIQQVPPAHDALGATPPGTPPVDPSVSTTGAPESRDEPPVIDRRVLGSERGPGNGHDDVGSAAHSDGHVAKGTVPLDRFLWLALGALGVVYGDIGTSPLYTFNECFNPRMGLHITPENILGITSLIFWSLTLVVVYKYITFVMSADNNGEGGVIALVALLRTRRPGSGDSLEWLQKYFVPLGLIGTSLLLSEGIITPAITVLSAIEGLEVATKAFQPVIVPLTLFILIVLFLVQRRGTSSVGAIFGPTMMAWFVSIGLLGLYWIVQAPASLAALNPMHGISMFVRHGWHGFLLLGSVILCFTGAEALFADMGHFGRRPIVLSWYAVVYPALVLCYLGQASLLLLHGEAVRESIFYGLVPQPLLYPMVFLATAAAIVASQALISGAFSIAQQAMQLGYTPRLTIVHTSRDARSQIYVPEVNFFLMFASCLLVLAFQKSSNLAAAYGFSVMGTMTITTILMLGVSNRIWGWPVKWSVLLMLSFLAFDFPFLLANAGKIPHGGWVPILIGTLIYTSMTTWNRGRAALYARIKGSLLPLSQFFDSVTTTHTARVPGTAVFMTGNIDVVPLVLLHHFKHNKVLHERIVLLSIVTEDIPEVPLNERIAIMPLKLGFTQLIARFGYMQTPNVPDIFHQANTLGFKTDINDTSFYLGRETILRTGQSVMNSLSKWMFCLMSRNARPPTMFFNIPPNRVVEFGNQIEI